MEDKIYLVEVKETEKMAKIMIAHTSKESAEHTIAMYKTMDKVLGLDNTYTIIPVELIKENAEEAIADVEKDMCAATDFAEMMKQILF